MYAKNLVVVYMRQNQISQLPDWGLGHCWPSLIALRMKAPAFPLFSLVWRFCMSSIMAAQMMTLHITSDKHMLPGGSLTVQYTLHTAITIHSSQRVCMVLLCWFCPALSLTQVFLFPVWLVHRSVTHHLPALNLLRLTQSCPVKDRCKDKKKRGFVFGSLCKKSSSVFGNV